MTKCVVALLAAFALVSFPQRRKLESCSEARSEYGELAFDFQAFDGESNYA